MRLLWTTAVAAGALVALALAGTASASCVGPLTAKQFEQRADVVFVGTALEGPTSTGIQRFRVERYLKGTGPETVPVSTGVEARSDGTGMTTSVSVNVSAGERWQIYARARPGSEVLATNLCDGSGKLARKSSVGTSIPNRSGAATGGGEDHTRAVLLATTLAVLALFALALGVRRRLRRTVPSAG